METTTSDYSPQIEVNQRDISVNKASALEYALGVDQIAQLRNRERDVFYTTQSEAYEKGATSAEALSAATTAAQRVNDDYASSVKETGFFSDDVIRQTSSILQSYSILAMSDRDWRLKGDTHQASGRERLEGEARTIIDTLGDSEMSSTDPYIEAEKQKLNTLRRTLASLSADRQGHLFGKGGDKYQQAQADYNEQVIALGRLVNKDIIDDDTRDQAEKNKVVIEYLFDEQNALRRESLEQLGDKPVRKVIEKFSEFMNRGSKKMRLVKNIGLGAAIGVTAGLVGGLGAGFAIAAGAGAVTARLARAYAMAEAKKNPDMKQLDDTEKQAAATQLASGNEETAEANGTDIFERLQDALTQTFEDTIDKEQSKRRKSVGKAFATVAIAAAVGSVGHAFVTGGDMFGFGAHDTHAAPQPESPAGSGGAGDHAGDEPLPGDTNGDGIVNELDQTPELPVPDPHFSVEYGEGGIQLFESLGLDEANWYQVHQELLQNFPNDFYSMGEGQVGLAHPGQLSIEAQEFIKARFPQLSYTLAA